jgi:predicted nucleotidyltransferase/predicted GNAT family acetyltransferase
VEGGPVRAQEFIVEYTVHKFNGLDMLFKDLGDDMIQIEATAQGRELGYVTFVQEGDTLLPQDLEVDERYRRQGIAAAMYDFAKSQGYKIRRSGQQTDAGAGFWDKHRPQQNVWENKQPGSAVVDAIRKVMPAAQEIWFHGSRATGKHRRNSDTDILVVIPDNLVGDQYLGAVRILQKLNSHFDNYDIQPTKAGTNIHRIAQEEGRLLWSNKQGVAEGKHFDRCFDEACKLYDRAVSKKLEPKLVQVADFQGDGSGADARWIKLPQHVWQHYVVIVGDKVLDPTATQFGDNMPTKYTVSELDKLWAKQYLIRPRQGVAEAVNRQGFERGFEQTKLESVDVDAIHAAALREHLLVNPAVLEGRDDTNRIKHFLDLHSTPRPHVGNQYVYASVQITPLADYVNIAHFGSQHQLIDLTHDHAYFDMDGTTKRFPEKGSLPGDTLSRIYFFDSKKDFDQFAIMLSLKLSDYKHSSQLLDEPKIVEDIAMTENFADGKNPQDRGDSARHGIPRHATIAQLEKIRSSKTASARKKQLAHWQINMRRGRAKARK